MKTSKHPLKTKRLVSVLIAMALLVSANAVMFIGKGVQAGSKPKNSHSKISGGLQDKIKDAHKGKDKLVMVSDGSAMGDGYVSINGLRIIVSDGIMVSD